MVAGRGVAHSERGGPVLHQIPKDSEGRQWLQGLQMWLALPKQREEDEPSFHFTQKLPPLPRGEQGVEASLLLGSAGGVSSPLPTFSPLFFLDVSLQAGTRFELPVEPTHEAAVYCAQGEVEVGGQLTTVHEGTLATYAASEGYNVLACTAKSRSRIAVFGGSPLPEKRHIWWNFVASEKGMIAQAAHNWETANEQFFGTVVNESGSDVVPLPEKYKF